MISRRSLFIIMAILVIVLAVVIVLLPRGTAPTEIVIASTGPGGSQSAGIEESNVEKPAPASGGLTSDVSLEQSSQSDTITFIESDEMKLPSLKENLQYGQMFHLCGTIKADSPLKSVTVAITDENSASPTDPYVTTVSFGEADEVEEYLLEDLKNPDAKNNIGDIVLFSSLKPGPHTLTLSASTFSTGPIVLASTEFIVDKSEWLQLISNNFRNNYLEALNFFGDKKRFLFKYQWADKRNIIIDPEWVEKYIVSMDGLCGKTWRVHVDAVSCFREALEYLDSTYVRVRGNGHDSGVIKLSKLVKTSNGTYVPRFVTDRTFISHHAFGTAVDLNANIVPNNDETENRDIIRTEVKNCLKYNGINESEGKNYYDFTYSGHWEQYYRDIPTSVLNYLIYELAFYRAGFGWGYYYEHTCDAMHYTLTERDIAEHSAPATGLRKVYEYIES